jgi:hypothetical protein
MGYTTAKAGNMVRVSSMLAFDRSLRSKDVDGRLHVERCNISKAIVNPYLGSEIPGFEDLGLNPGQTYYMLRDPEELRKAAPTFNNLPVLLHHIPVSADDPRQDLVVGTTGSDAEFDAPYLCTSMAIWTAEAIALIESEQQEQLSSAYRYEPDMTPGVYEGTRYDGVMRNIVGNHVALVEVGRAGPDVVVSDEEISTMRNAKLIAGLKKYLAQDANVAALDEDLSKMVGDDSDDDEDEDDPENPGQRRKKKPAMDVGLTNEQVFAIAEDAAKKATVGMVTKADMDAAVTAATVATEAKYRAREVVRPIIGEVTLDSAEAIYGAALKHLDVDVEGVPPAAYPALLKAVAGKKAAPSAPTMDATLRTNTLVAFPDLKRFHRG